MKKFTLILAIITWLITNVAFAQKTWTGTTSTAWNLAGNWSPSGIPTASDNVTIPSAPSNQPLISGTTTPVCNNLTVNSGATLTITGTTSANALLTVSGTATFNGTLSIGGSTIRTGTLTAANVVWNSTSSISPFLNARMNVSGNWTFASGSSINMGNCWVTFTGTGNSLIYNYSANSVFGSLGFSKTATATTSYGTGTNATLTINSGFSIDANNTFTGGQNITTIVKGNMVINGKLDFYSGTMRLESTSGTQSVQMAGTNNRVNNLVINCGGTVTLNNQLDINGNLTIQSGIFDPQNNTIYVTGNWINTAGPAYFTEGTGKVVFNVIINKDGGKAIDQVIQNTEVFNILEVNNAYGDLIINSAAVTVTCAQYDWVAGGLNVSAGTLTALDLVDNGLFGKYTVSGTGTINVTNNDGYVDLCGNVNITGGTMNVYGGTTESYWPYTNNAFITMSNGILNFVNQGIRVTTSTLTLTSNITGGTIKTAKSFSNYRSDFNPTGGTIEMYGATDASLYCVGTAALYSLNINKTASKDGDTRQNVYTCFDRETGEVLKDEIRAQSVSLTTALTLNGNFTLTGGTFNSNSNTIQAKRDWTNNAGSGSFNPGTGRVIFNGGNYHQYCYNETFNILELNKASGGAFRLSSNTSVTCAVYDWTAGSIDVLANGGTFTALDLFDNGIFGGYYVNPGGMINLYQDSGQYVDLSGNITFTGGGTMNVYGGSSISDWPFNNNASLTMNAGVLDFKSQGIRLLAGTNTLTTNITGGTIRTVGSFNCARSDFNPTGGAIELSGAQNTSLSMSAGSLYNLTVNKSVANNVSLSTNITLTGGLSVNGGTLNMNGKTLVTGRESAVNTGGILDLNAGSSLLISGTWWININDGGLLRVIGAAGNPAMISRNGASGYIYLNVMNGGTISARNAWFHYFNPLRVISGGLIDPNNPFDDCQFRYTATGMLWVENEQTLLIKNTEFLTPATGYNVRKSSNNGELTFKDATGNYAGATYENDPYNRIHWTVTQPGLWTGVVSSNWHTAGNWDDGVVPTSSVNVTIPVSAPYMPVISTNAACNNLTLNGTLTINDPTLTVSGNATIAGHLILNYELARFVVMGDLTWQSGSTASQNHIDTEILVYGNFTFNAGSNVQLNNGGVRFRGASNKSIINHSSNSWFYNLVSHKTSGAYIDFNSASTQSLRVNGSLSTETGARFKASSGQYIELKGNLLSYGTIEFDWARLALKGVDQYIRPNVNDYLYFLDFNQSGTATISTVNSNVLDVRGGISIISGIFNAGSSTIKVQGGWVNWAGASAFIAGNSRVIFENVGTSEIFENEAFNILEINKGAGVILINSRQVVCNSFDFTSGLLRVANGGVFTANDLADDGIFGDFELQSGSTVNLYQDIYQHVDLGGNLWITGGSTINVYGGNGWSQWPYGANAMLYMTDGTLDFKDQGINVNSMSPNTLTLDITGGTIRTSSGFFCNRAGFTPAAGTLELYGGSNTTLEMYAGSLYNLTINKNSSVSLLSNATINGLLQINGGDFIVNGTTLTLKQHSEVINTASRFKLLPNSIVRMASGKVFNVGSGATFESLGTPTNKVLFRNDGSGYYQIFVNEGGTISAANTQFHYVNPLTIMPGGTVDPLNPLSDCQFRYATTGSLAINNSQNLFIRNVEFLKPNSGYNASKTLNTGTVNFRDAFGDHAGVSFEQDPNGKIYWTATQPGLWTGVVSTNWHTAGNWDDNAVPTSTTNVTIPASAPNMPLITNGVANCQNLLINGTLTIGAPDVSASGNMTVNGTLAMNHDAGRLFVYGDVNWNSGSGAAITANSQILAYGNWYFNAGANASLGNGTVKFYGETTTNIRNQSSNCTFYNLSSYKSPGAILGFSASSTSPLKINGMLTTSTGSRFVSYSGQDIVVKGNIVSYGTLQCTDGAVKLDGTDQYITPNVNDYFHRLIFSQTGNVMIITQNVNTFYVLDDLTIQSGTFIPGNVDIFVGGDWNNSAGSEAFIETGSTVVFNGSGNVQRIQTDENFLTLELNKPSGGLLEISNNAEVYTFFHHWTAGALSVVSGNYTAPNLTNGVMGGDIAVNSGGTITMGKNTSATNLIGRLFITGGTFNLITNGQSQWPGNGNAQITMSSGELNVYPGGINIVNNPPYLFVTEITGGTIRTEGSFNNGRSDFNPTSGTVELYGSENVTLGYSISTMYNLNNLIINKTSLKDNDGTVTLTGKILLRSLNIEKGTLNCTSGNVIVVVEDVDVNDEAKLSFEPNTVFGLYPSCQVIINQGGTFESLGTEDQPIVVDRWGGTGFYDFGVGGTISSRFTTFNNCGNLIVAPSGYIDPDNAFYHCTFPYAVGAYLMINNNQNVTLRGVQFPNVPISMNVKKLLDQGRVIMKDATGPGAGPAYEYDPYNRIDWAVTQPGLWTGIVSSDWDNPENWDDLSVPTYQTDVLIPEVAPHMPAVSAEAGCGNITVMGEIAIFENNLWVSGNANIYGHVNNDAGFRIFGSLYWQEGSTATFGDDGAVNILGDWYFNPGSQVNLTNGTVYFSGQMPSSIFSFSSQSAFNKLQLMKDPAIQVTLDVSSDQPLNINGNLLVMGGNGFYSYSAQDINLKGSTYNHGVIRCEAGRFVLKGADQSIQPNVSDYFNTLVFNQTGLATISTYHTNVLNVKKDLIIESGVFSPGGSKVKIGRDWMNNVGLSAFAEGTSRVIFNGSGPQFSSSEHFYIFELDKPVEHLYLQDNNSIICDVYDWTNGGMWIAGEATFVANDLADDGIYGFIHLFDGNVELYQDATQTVDLRGHLMISGGEFKIWGGTDETVWGTNANATLTMVNGVLNFNDHTIRIQDAAPYSFTSTITGGTIRTQKSFFAQSPGFNPTGGTVELYGEQNSALLSSDGSTFYNVYINKSNDISVRATIWNSVVKNSFMVAEGLAEIVFGQELECWNNIEIADGGWLATNSSTISMKHLAAINVFSNGRISLFGYEGAMSHVKSDVPGQQYTFSILYGGYFEAMFTIFEDLPEQGVYLAPGAIVNPNYSLTNCEFRNGTAGASTLLTIDNDQDIVIQNAVFPTNSWGGQYNARKLVDAGSVTFVNPTGAFAGEAYENDPYNRIHWIIPQPGLWTGAVSTDWFTAGNWDDGNVPTSATNVTIPVEVVRMPMISSGTAYCNNIVLNGSITVGDATLDIAGNLEATGNLTTTNTNGKIIIRGDANWNSGATASLFINSVIWSYGNWSFNEGSNVQPVEGTVFFMGNTTKTLSNYSPNSAFGGLFIYKTGGAYVNLTSASNQPIFINSTLRVNFNSQLIINSDELLTVSGNLYIDGNLQCNSGTIRFSGLNSNIRCSSADYFNHVVFDQSGTALLYDSFSEFNVRGDLTINSGIFNPGNNTIKIQGSWYNNAGPDHFSEGNSRVIFNGSVPQFCSTEEFYILEIDKPLHYFYDKSESNIFCQIYDWTQGGMWIAGGSTFHAADLADDGIYGDFVLWWDAIELHQDALQSIDLHGSISVNGGEFRVYGGNDQSLWGTNANANLFMGSGVLDFVDQGIKIQDAAPYSFTSTISGGTIRTQKSFIVQSPGFDPMGGTVELYGAQNSAILSTEGGAFYNVTINKPSDFSTRATIWSSIVKNNFVVAEGLADVGFGHELECWNNLEIQDGGWLATSSSTISMKYLSSINVFQNGQLSLYGYEGATSHVKGVIPGQQYTFSILDGGNLEAMFTIFENLPEQGVYLAPGAVVNPNYSFTNCEFRNGMSGPTALLTVDNDQDIIIQNAFFPTNTWGGQYNVRKLVDAGSVTFVNASGDFAGSDFENDPFGRIFWGDEFATHPISIPAGWSGISSYVIPGQPALEDVFASISDELIIAQTMTGVYFPGENINTIGNWEDHSAYKVKTSAACTLTITGDYETDLSVSLNAGWNLLPVVTPDGAPAADLLSPVNGFVIAKDVAGTGIYWPEYGINTMEYLLPGKAYFVLLSEAGDVDFTGYKSNFTGRKNLSASLDLTAFNIQPSPSSHTIALLPEAVKAFEQGTLIGAYDQAGNCFGITEIGEENNAITIFGDDPTTAVKDGFFEGEIILFKNLSGLQNLTGLEPTFDQNLPQSDGLFTENGLSAINSFKASTGILGNKLLSNVKVFPNPSDGLVNISGIIPGTALTVTDLNGQVLMERIADSDNTEFDLTGYQPGVYFIKISQNGTNIFRKIVLR